MESFGGTRNLSARWNGDGLYDTPYNDPGWEFLKAHDELAKKRTRSRMMEYPYLTPRQLAQRRAKELPLYGMGNWV